MALFAKHNDVQFGVGDVIRVKQQITEGDKVRLQNFEGKVIAIKGREENKSFTVRKIGAGQIGIERIFPFKTPTIAEVLLIRAGTTGVRRSKLYYTRDISKRESEKIFTRQKRRTNAK